ncbi:uncharacterized protein A4U43_C04F1910 [Asparagus officinalis]|uniref:C2 domain-containing protein n=1 Tax=Asparagus officinalis TaxID=4686 RepID=A0A5P1EY82_ASPOF|nr:uncharacterized protein A4U43_C04F1910 [Asparagus officinalis]
MHATSRHCRRWLPPNASPAPPYALRLHHLEVTTQSPPKTSSPPSSPQCGPTRSHATTAHKLKTRPDNAGNTNPTWNETAVFRLDDAVLESDTSAINFDIYAARSKFRPGRDTLLGTARALISTIRPDMSVQFLALQIRRKRSLRPQGILNIGVALGDGYVRSLPVRVEARAPAAAKRLKSELPAVKVEEEAKRECEGREEGGPERSPRTPWLCFGGNGGGRVGAIS